MSCPKSCPSNVQVMSINSLSPNLYLHGNRKRPRFLLLSKIRSLSVSLFWSIPCVAHNQTNVHFLLTIASNTSYIPCRQKCTGFFRNKFGKSRSILISFVQNIPQKRTFNRYIILVFFAK